MNSLKIEQKYQKSINDLIDYYHEIKKRTLNDYRLTTSILKKLKKKLMMHFNIAFEAGLKLSELRKKLAKKLASEMILELKDLDLDKATFEIIFDEITKDEAQLLETGLDQVEFMISK